MIWKDDRFEARKESRIKKKKKRKEKSLHTHPSISRDKNKRWTEELFKELGLHSYSPRNFLKRFNDYYILRIQRTKQPPPETYLKIPGGVAPAVLETFAGFVGKCWKFSRGLPAGSRRWPLSRWKFYVGHVYVDAFANTRVWR